ncbi:MAG: radical SAM protein, partial [Oscillospiraceae bacterium]|nr:radical SAM protein [Oscillospiraceae bacterium]
MLIRLYGIAEDSIVDGPGIRLAVFGQGCPHRCPGCHNPGSHDPDGGFPVDTGLLLEKLRGNPLYRGITLSGGEPFYQPEPMAELARGARAMGRDVVCYTGYTVEYLLEHADENPGWRALMEAVDLLIDGPYIEAERSLLLRFRGSANQRYIDMPATLAAG